MKLYEASPFRSIVFKNEKTCSKSDQTEVQQPDKNSNNKKLLYAALGALAILGTATVIINNVRKGKAQEAARKAQAEAERQASELAEKLEKEAVEKEQAYFDKTYNSVNKSAKESAEVFDTYLNNKEYVSNLKQYLRTKTPMNSESIDARLNPEVKEGTWSKEDMKAYYESDCVEIHDGYYSFKELIYPKDLKNCQKIKRIYKKNNDNIAEGSVEIITKKYPAKPRWYDDSDYVHSKLYSPDGELLKEKMITHKQNVIKYFENGKLSKISSEDKYGTSETIFTDGIKTSIRKNKDGSQIFKIYEQDKNGKYHCIRREIISDHNTTLKEVEYINDGKYSKTTSRNIEYTERNENIKTVIRDRKGNIVDESKIKASKSGKPSKGSSGAKGAKGADGAQDTEGILASWYKDYLKLCKEYGVSPRACGVKGGAGDHWFELCMRRNDPVAYGDYLKLQAHRAKYSEDAMLMQILRMADSEMSNLSPEKLSKLSKEELQLLLKSIHDGSIKVEELENLSPKKIKESIKNVEEKKNLRRISGRNKSIILDDPNNTLIISHGNPYKSSYKQAHKAKEVTVCK